MNQTTRPRNTFASPEYNNYIPTTERESADSRHFTASNREFNLK